MLSSIFVDRPRLAIVIATITWTVEGTLLMRSLFLAIAGGAAIALALVLGRLLPREAAS